MIVWAFFLCGCRVAREHNPGPEVQTDEELIAWIKQYTNSIARMYSFSSSSSNLLDTPDLGWVHSLTLYVTLYRVRRYIGDLLDAPARQGWGRRSTIEG